MKTTKRILVAFILIAGLLLGVAAALPYFFKDELVARAKQAINEQVRARVEFTDVHISLLRRFPDLSFALNELTVQGVDTFSDVTLLQTRQLDLTLDLFSVLRKQEPIRLEAVTLRDPILDIRVLSDGRANYDIAPQKDATTPPPDPAAGSEYTIALEKYTISNGSLRYADATLDMLIDLQGIQHQGKGNITASVYDLDTRTTTESTRIQYGGIDYLDGVAAELDAILQIDQKNLKYTLKDNDLTLNALHLYGEGFVQLLEEGILLDFEIEAPSNDFKELLSLVPGAYLQGYEDVQASGTFALNASVEGIYNGAQSAYPAFLLNLDIQDASVQYPDLPLGIRQIAASAKVNSPGSNLDELTVQVPTFSLAVADNPIRGRFSLARPISNPTVDAALNGRLDLEQLAQAYPLPDVDKLRGTLTADVAIAASMNQIERKQYDAVTMNGQLTATDILYQTAAYPEVRLASAKMDFSPQYVALNELNLTAGKSDLQVEGRLDNLLAYFSPEKTMTGQMRVRSNLLDANEWTTTGSEATGTAPAPAPGGTDAVFDRFDFSLDAAVGTLLYEDYTLKNTVARGSLTPQRLSIAEAATTIEDSDLQVTGYVDHIFGYLFSGETLEGDLTITSRKLNLNTFMEAYAGEPASAPPATDTPQEYGIVRIPENIQMRIRANIEELQYTDLTLRELAGALEVAEQAVALRDIVAQTFGGTMRLDGMYDTSDPTPAYSVVYGMENMQFQSAFQALNTMQALAPVGQFLEGIFTSRLMMEGTLGDNMMPDLNTLNAKGFLETVKGTLKTYPPLQSIANTFNIQELKNNISLQNTRNWVEINQGRVDVKPFDLTVQEIPMTITGSHGLNQQMAYDIKAAIPRSRLENNAVGAAAGNLMGQLQSEASKLGLPFTQSETVNVLIELTGSLTQPQVNVRLLGLDGDTSAGEQVMGAVSKQVEAGKEQLKEETKAALEQAEEQVRSEAQKLLDSAQVQAEQKLEETKKGVEAQVDTLLKEQAKKILDETKAKEEVDKLKKELEKFNPFKKQKKQTPETKPTEEKKKTEPDTTKKSGG